jgi:hypothetical protein
VTRGQLAYVPAALNKDDLDRDFVLRLRKLNSRANGINGLRRDLQALQKLAQDRLRVAYSRDR